MKSGPLVGGRGNGKARLGPRSSLLCSNGADVCLSSHFCSGGRLTSLPSQMFPADPMVAPSASLFPQLLRVI